MFVVSIMLIIIRMVVVCSAIFLQPFNLPTLKYNSSIPAVTSGDYIGSCRLLRIDGCYKLMPDWNMVKLL